MFATDVFASVADCLCWAYHGSCTSDTAPQKLYNGNKNEYATK